MLNLATWNLHRARGADGRVDPARILALLAGTPGLAGADVLALQEAEAEAAPYGTIFPPGALEAETGLWSVHGPGLRFGPDSEGWQGNVLLLSPALAVAAARVVPLGGRYPRSAVIADVVSDVVAGGGAPVRFRVVATHLSLGQPLRILQMRRIARALAALPPLPLLLLGDLNEWRPWGGLALGPAVTGCRLHGPARRTFPAARPLLPLDRILCDRAGALGEVRALDGAALRAASDHLPLAARLDLSRLA